MKLVKVQAKKYSFYDACTNITKGTETINLFNTPGLLEVQDVINYCEDW